MLALTHLRRRSHAPHEGVAASTFTTKQLWFLHSTRRPEQGRAAAMARCTHVEGEGRVVAWLTLQVFPFPLL